MPKIHKIDITPVQIKLTEPFIISKGPLYHATITIVRIYLDDGRYGIGECCPFRTIHGETQEGTVAAGISLAQLLIGREVTEIRHIVALMDRQLAGNASIKCAFDMALYDLNAKMVGLPLYKYLNGRADKVMFTDMTVSLMLKEKMVDKAIQFKEQGFPVLKVKLGDRPSSKDVDRMTAIRDAVGDIPLRIDANQGWNYLEATRALNGMAYLEIEHCEAPISALNHHDLSRIRAESPIPIMGDESVFTHRDAIQVILAECIDMINIKLGKSGGICHAMKIASIAESLDMYCQVGGFSESRLGMSALVHFSRAWDNIIYFDLDSALMHDEDPIIGGLTYHKDWSVTVDETPGHGADYDPLFLKKFETITI